MADDPVWEAFVAAMLAAGPASERRSRYGDKPALVIARREIAHLEAPGVIDLRITRAARPRPSAHGQRVTWDSAAHRQPRRVNRRPPSRPRPRRA